MAFAENLRLLRVDRFLTQAELARRAGLHALTVTRLEAGTTAPSVRTLQALARALEVEPRELATPVEVAELRRVLAKRRPPAAAGDRQAGDRQAGAQERPHEPHPDAHGDQTRHPAEVSRQAD
jgi:transcriptional regulator with XRE-family HTH domain